MDTKHLRTEKPFALFYFKVIFFGKFTYNIKNLITF